MATHATPSCPASARAQGQACECGARLFVQEGIYDEFVKKSIELAKQRKVGRGLGQELRAHHPGAPKLSAHVPDQLPGLMRATPFLTARWATPLTRAWPRGRW